MDDGKRGEEGEEIFVVCEVLMDLGRRGKKKRDEMREGFLHKERRRGGEKKLVRPHQKAV
jgi:hypothetical protein